MPIATFSPGTTIKSSEMNGNFSDCVLCDTARTVTVTHTWSASQTFTGGWTAGAACTVTTGGLTVTAGGITVTGNSTITGSLTGVTALSMSGEFLQSASGFRLATAILRTEGATLSATATGPGLEAGYNSGTTSGFVQAYDRTGAAFTNLTLSGATVIMQYGTSGTTGLTLNSSGSLVFSPAASKIVPGATSISLRNHADSADNVIVSDAGAVTTRAGITTSGHLLFSPDATYNIGAVGATRPANIYASGSIFSGSSRALKERVEPFSRDALDILNDIDVVSYRYKANPDVESVGFIAEEVDELLSGPDKKDFNINNSIGLLIKAVQQLSGRR